MTRTHGVNVGFSPATAIELGDPAYQQAAWIEGPVDPHLITGIDQGRVERGGSGSLLRTPVLKARSAGTTRPERAVAEGEADVSGTRVECMSVRPTAAIASQICLPGKQTFRGCILTLLLCWPVAI